MEIHYKSCGEIFKVSIFLLAGQQRCSYAVREAYKPGNEWKGYTPKPAPAFAARIYDLFPNVWRGCGDVLSVLPLGMTRDPA